MDNLDSYCWLKEPRTSATSSLEEPAEELTDKKTE